MSGISIASPPFDEVSANVIIRSSDNVDFYVMKYILSLASPFFKAMFSLSQQSPEEPATSTTANVKGRETVPVTEDSKTIDTLLRLCYPQDDGLSFDLPLTEKVLGAALKYEMTKATRLTKTTLRNFIHKSPLDVYVVSSRLRIEEEARLAAQGWKSTMSANPVQTVRFEDTMAGAIFRGTITTLNAGAYYRLLYYLHGGAKSESMRFVDGGDPAVDTTRSAQTDKPHKSVSPSSGMCLHDAIGADTVLVSHDGVKFPVHSAVLHVASAGGLLVSSSSEAQAITNSDTTHSLPKSTISIHSKTLAELLRLCYPFERVDVTNLSLMTSVYAAATKWNIPKVMSAIRAEFKEAIPRHNNPLSLYFVAVMQGWNVESRAIAGMIAQRGIQYSYTLEMENVPAIVYHNLLRFCDDFSVKARDKLTSLVPYYSFPQGDSPLVVDKSVSLCVVVNSLKKGDPVSPRTIRCVGCPFCQKNQESKVNALLEESKIWEESVMKVLSEVRFNFYTKTHSELKVFLQVQLRIAPIVPESRG